MYKITGGANKSKGGRAAGVGELMGFWELVSLWMGGLGG